jgi:hypothetical protein
MRQGEDGCSSACSKSGGDREQGSSERAAAEFISRHLGDKLPELIRILAPARQSNLFLALQEIANGKAAAKNERKQAHQPDQLALPV